ncbi:uncharacterized protein OCT59_023070 [Rhizophagus irregularis]|uniref:uncharacterized protein n=1 Tax=Rhizophagus irregularis TaxID=588596 RepID=UPI00331BDBA9|nr:hypothetical protein OCT59_023070 [Rhizophagus irregularis]
MKRASEAMANKYKISSRRVYQIWRGAYPQIDPKDINQFSEEPGSPQQADPVECNVISENTTSFNKLKKFKYKQ